MEFRKSSGLAIEEGVQRSSNRAVGSALSAGLFLWRPSPSEGLPVLTQRSPLMRILRAADGRGWRTPRDPLKEALTALADVLAKRPAQEILFDWFRSGRLVGDSLS
jgi:hypothetical protein